MDLPMILGLGAIITFIGALEFARWKTKRGPHAKVVEIAVDTLSVGLLVGVFTLGAVAGAYDDEGLRFWIFGMAAVFVLYRLPRGLIDIRRARRDAQLPTPRESSSDLARAE